MLVYIYIYIYIYIYCICSRLSPNEMRTQPGLYTSTNSGGPFLAKQTATARLKGLWGLWGLYRGHIILGVIRATSCKGAHSSLGFLIFGLQSLLGVHKTIQNLGPWVMTGYPKCTCLVSFFEKGNTTQQLNTVTLMFLH